MSRTILCLSELLDTYLVAMQDAEQFLGFLHSLSDMGAAMRRVMADALTNKDVYKTLTTGENNSMPEKVYIKFFNVVILTRFLNATVRP